MLWYCCIPAMKFLHHSVPGDIAVIPAEHATEAAHVGLIYMQRPFRVEALFWLWALHCRRSHEYLEHGRERHCLWMLCTSTEAAAPPAWYPHVSNSS